jgi:phosphoserine phosphatase RsbU/P
MRAVHRLVDAVHHARPEDLSGIAMLVASDLGALEMVMYLVDYEQTTLVPHPGAQAPLREPLPIDGTLPGRSFATGEPLRTSADNEHRVWVPIIDGTERLGVLEFVTDIAPDAGQIDEFRMVTSLFAETLVCRRLYGDAIERTRRRLPMQLAAEIIWNQLPPLTFATADVAVSAILEPCYEVGGDAFDYAINGDTLHVAILDGVGHGIVASALTSLTLNAYRNARRCGLNLSDTYRSIDKWVHAQYPDSYVTAVLGELDIRTGIYRGISAGHPGALLLRDGRLVKELPAPTSMPLGLGYLGDPIPGIAEESLEPGDKLLLYTDGVVEARTEAQEVFGLARLTEFVTRALADQLPAAETMRRLVHAILAHQHERLQDDATAALLEWRPEFTYGVLPT